MFVDGVEELLDPAGPEGLLAVLPETRLVILREIGVVGVKGEAGSGLCSWGHCSNGIAPVQSKSAEEPSTGTRPSPDFRKGTRPGFRKPMSPRDVGKDKVLGRRLKEPERVEKFAPASRGIDPHHRFGRRVAIAKSGKGEGDRLSRPGEIRQVRVDVREDGTMPGRADRKLNVRAALHTNRLFAASRTASVRRAEVFRRVGRIDGFDKKVLNVRNPRSSAPKRSNRSGRARRPERPGIVAPLSDSPGVTTRAKYHRIGALSSRCGSLARIGFPVSVRDPATTHSFDAPFPIPVNAPSSSSMLSMLAWVSPIAGRVVTGSPGRAPGKSQLARSSPSFAIRRARRSLSLKFCDSW